MGLKEKRLINVVKDENIPAHQSYAKDNYGIDINFDLDWDEWNDSYDAALNLNGYVLDQAMQALYKVAHDDEGKAAIAEGVRTIFVRLSESAESKSMTLADGKLQLVVAPGAGWDGTYHHGDITEFLTDNL